MHDIFLLRQLCIGPSTAKRDATRGEPCNAIAYIELEAIKQFDVSVYSLASKRVQLLIRRKS
jgi:hypothetical protein